MPYRGQLATIAVMRKIYFDQHNARGNVILLTLAAICIMIGLWHISVPDSSIWYRRINTFGYFLLVIVLAKPVVRKYYVGWSKRGIFIKIGSYFGKSIRFKDIATIEFSENVLHIRKKDGHSHSFNLSGISEKDVAKLTEILATNTGN